MYFILINTDKDHPILGEETLRHLETRIDHIQPVCMEAPVAVQILFEIIDHISVLIIGNIRRNEIPARHRKVIIVHKGIIPSIVGWIDIDHLHLAEVRLLQQLQHIEVIPLDVEILAVKRARRAVPPDAVRHDGA